MEVGIFNKMFTDGFEDQTIKNNRYNNFFNAKRDLDVSGFEIGKMLADVDVKLSQSSQQVQKLQNILKNFNLKLDNLIKFNVNLNRKKSNINSGETNESLKRRIFNAGDFIDIEFTLSIPNGDFTKDKKSKLLPTNFFNKRTFIIK